jgi:hypothetical protein
MGNLKKKLDNLSDLLKQFNASIKMPKGPKPPRASAGPAKPKIGIAPTNKKDPVKVAEQIKNPDMKPMVMDAAKQTREALKVSKLGQWNIVKADDDSSVPPPFSQSLGQSTAMAPKPPELSEELTTVHSDRDGFKGAFHPKQEQHDLIHGIDFTSRRDKLNEQQEEGVSKDVGWYKNKQGKNVIVKSAAGHHDIKKRGADKFTAPEREVLFHNMANDFFGLGKHVPTIAGFVKDGIPHSAQAEVENGNHVPRSPLPDPKGLFELPDDYNDTINNLYKSGELHKMAMMDTLMGHHDRHRSNFMYNPKQKDRLHLIDNATAFDYDNIDSNEKPAYWAHAISSSLKNMNNPDAMHPEAKKWLLNLDPEKAKKMFNDHGYYEGDPQTKGFLTRLQHMQEAVKDDKYNNMSKMLSDNKFSTGPSWFVKHPEDMPIEYAAGRGLS